MQDSVHRQAHKFYAIQNKVIKLSDPETTLQYLVKMSDVFIAAFPCTKYLVILQRYVVEQVRY